MAIAPLVPADVDLRDFPFMPIDITRLFGSEFHSTTTDSEWRAGVTLWLKSFHQVPAASLPADDVSLARLAELGRDVRAWRKVKEKALRGWEVASDGRYYHRTVSEKALEAWIDKLGQRKSSGAGNAKKYGREFDPSAIEAQIEVAAELLAALNPQSRALRKRPSKAPGGTPDGTPDPLPTGSQETGKRREGKSSVSLRSTERTAHARENSFARFFDRWKAKVGNEGEAAARREWVELGCDEHADEIIAGVDRYVANKPKDRLFMAPSRFLRDERWRDHAPSGPNGAFADRVLIVEGSDEFAAWAKHKGESLVVFDTEQRDKFGRRIRGRYERTRWPPGHAQGPPAGAQHETAA